MLPEAQNQAAAFRQWIKEIDLQSADLLETERAIYRALYNSQFTFHWQFVPIAPLSEPVDIDSLVGDTLRDAQRELNGFAQRTDYIYSALSDTNNSYNAEIAGLERAVLEATDALNDINFTTQDQNTQYYWISESFNTTNQIDPASTALIDTDRGYASLSPTHLSILDNFTVTVDKEQTKGIPGCNLLVLNYKTALTPNKEPDPQLESSASYNMSAAFDSDPTSWFEIERNFIPPKQKLVRQGKAYKSDATGKLMDVKEATKDLDWRVYIQWPGEIEADAGPDGKGIYIAEFRDIAGSGVAGGNTISVNQFEEDTEAKLVLDINLNEPTQISAITINPFNRANQPIKVEKLSVYTEGVEIPITDNTILNLNKSSGGVVEREVLRRTGSQSVGVFFSVPTDRAIEKIKISLVSPPATAKYGLAHLFKEQEVRTKTTTTFFGFKSSTHKDFWQRIPVNENPVGIYSKNKVPKLDGVLAPILNILGAVQLLQTGLQTGSNVATAQGTAKVAAGGQGLVANLAAGANLVNVGSTVSAGLKTLKLGGELGKAAAGLGGFLGQAFPIVGGAMLVSDLVGSLFGKKTTKVYGDSIQGYDVFNGQRSSVGIRDISIQQAVYSAESTVITTMRSFPGPVKKLGLYVDEKIPNSWSSGQWITYEVSVDGTVWVPIPKLSEVTIDNALDLPTPTTQIKLKATLKGNTEDVYHPSIINHITIQGLPAI